MRPAAIDIGTNSVHMIIVRVRPDLSFEVVDREKEMVRLGAGGLDGRRLAPTAVAAALETLAKFKRLAETHEVDEILASATSAVREAENGGDFVATVRRDLGIRVRVISGKEEARLIGNGSYAATADIDDLGIWARALAPDEVMGIFGAGMNQRPLLLAVPGQAPVISAQPASANVAAGGAAHFTVCRFRIRDVHLPLAVQRGEYRRGYECDPGPVRRERGQPGRLHRPRQQWLRRGGQRRRGADGL